MKKKFGIGATMMVLLVALIYLVLRFTSC